MIELMRLIARTAALMLCSLGALGMSACMMVSGSSTPPSINYTLGSGPPAASYSLSPNTGTGTYSSTTTYYSNGSSSSGSSSSGGYGASSSAGGYASSGGSSPDNLGANAAVPPGYSQDGAQTAALTSYLQGHRLPLVGAQVLSNSGGNREVVLYGFVATDFGKQDAANKARHYLNDPNATVLNRIAVRPELLASGSGSGAPSSSSAPSSGAYDPNASANIQGYENNQQPAQTQQYVQNQNSALGALMPLIGMMGMLSLGNSGVGLGYGGYPPTYGSPLGSPFSGPFGSPFGVPYNPYGTSPYGAPPSFGYPFSTFP